MFTNYKLFCPLFGLGIWLTITALIWSYGDVIFATISGGALSMTYPLLAVLMVMLMLVIIKRYELGIWQRLQAAILLVMPGMILDTFALQLFSSWFAQVEIDYLQTYAALMMWCYMTVLATALISRLWAE